MVLKVIDSMAHQLRLPTKGFFGWVIFHLLQRRNAGLEKAAAKLTAIEPHHNVLELGFGPGIGISHAAQYVKDGPGKVYGLELSDYMLEKASDRLQAEIQEGKVELRKGTVMDLPYDSGTFHRVFHCNCFYFWPSLEDGSKEIHRVMKPGGMMVTLLCTQALQDFKKKGLLVYGDIDHVKYMNTLEMTGFKDVKMEKFSKGSRSFEAIYAHIPSRPDSKT